MKLDYYTVICHCRNIYKDSKLLQNQIPVSHWFLGFNSSVLEVDRVWPTGTKRKITPWVVLMMLCCFPCLCQEPWMIDHQGERSNQKVSATIGLPKPNWIIGLYRWTGLREKFSETMSSMQIIPNIRLSCICFLFETTEHMQNKYEQVRNICVLTV